jgi:hypothetical protein
LNYRVDLSLVGGLSKVKDALFSIHSLVLGAVPRVSLV